jgi:hypothetical protein
MLKKLLPILFLFTGFQASAVVVIGNLTYNEPYISGDGRTYVGLDKIAGFTYQQTLDATQVGGDYEGFRIANTADADYFIGSLFGANEDVCSTVDGIASLTLQCGTVIGWADGIFGDSFDSLQDTMWFMADETVDYFEVGFVTIVESGKISQNERWGSRQDSDRYAAGGANSGNGPIGWLLVKDTIVQANEPSILALMVLGIFGIGFARRRR